MAENDEFKQVILVRMDLKMPKGKLAAQVAHASVDAMVRSDKRVADMWRTMGGKKVVLKVKDEAELLSFERLAKAAGLRCALIRDAGRTVLEPGTVTCLGIGPDNESKIDRVTGSLKVL